MLTEKVENPKQLPALVDPRDVTAKLEERARSWMHTNCAGCHRRLGPTPALMDWRYETPLSLTQACGEAPLEEAPHLPETLLVDPGNADNSMILGRASQRDDPFMMPPLGSMITDDEGLELVRQWLDSLDGCGEE